MAFFERVSDTTFLPTRHTGGAWNTSEQHIAPAIGLLAHALELDNAKRGTGFVIGRLSYDILGVIPIEPMQVEVRTVRPGRTVELVEASLCHNQRPALLMRGWLMKPRDTFGIGEPISNLARVASLFDVSNGMAVRASPQEIAFPNLDITIHLFDSPLGEWLGFDTSVTFGRNGIGLTSSIIHDENGPIGTIAQTLTVRP